MGGAPHTELSSGVGTFEGNGRYVVLIMIVCPACMKILTTGKCLQCVKGLVTKLSVI